MDGAAQAEQFGDKVKEGKLSWSVQVQRGERGCSGQRVLNVELPGTRKREIHVQCLTSLLEHHLMQFHYFCSSYVGQTAGGYIDLLRHLVVQHGGTVLTQSFGPALI